MGLDRRAFLTEEIHDGQRNLPIPLMCTSAIEYASAVWNWGLLKERLADGLALLRSNRFRNTKEGLIASELAGCRRYPPFPGYGEFSSKACHFRLQPKKKGAGIS